LISQSIDKIGIGFCYSPYFHPMTQALRDFRKQLNVPTTFNLLGPLLNPAHAAHYIMGVLDEKLLPIMADVLMQTGCKRSVIVHGMGLDEISTVGPVKIIEIDHHQKTEYCIDPLNFGLARCHISDLRGGDAMHNAQLLLEIFKGKPGPIADTLILNAAVALYICGHYSTIGDAVLYAQHILKSGSVLQLLNKWREFSHEQ
jgi:anthranilate phosphoribosyltransferase